MHRVSFTSALIATSSLLTSALAAQSPPPPPPPSSAIESASPEVCATLGVSEATIQSLWIPPTLGPGEFRLPVVLDGREVVLALRPCELRAPGFRLLLDGPGGIQPLPTPPSVTWRGKAFGRPDSFVAASIVHGAVEGVVRLDSGDELWAIQPLDGAPAPTGWGRYAVYRETHSLPTPHRCGVVQRVHPRQVAPPVTARGSSAALVCEIALEADSDYLSRLGGSTTAVQNDLTSVMNGVDAIFLADAQVTYSITTILIRTAANNPYSTNNGSGLLTQFRNEWVANQTSIQRDVAHLFTGRNISGSTIGIAYLGSICSQTQGFGVSQSRFSSNMTSRVALTAHELGHSWNANHCNSSNDCRIMCSSLGGCTGVRTSFGPTSRAVIQGFANSRSCLGSTAPLTLTSLQPSTVFPSEGQAATLSGTGLIGTVQLDIGPRRLLWPGGFTIVDDNTIRFSVPRATALGPTPVSTTDGSTRSNALNLIYQAHSPPRLIVGPTALAGYPLRFETFGTPGHWWFLFGSLLPTTAPIQGENVLLYRAELGLGTGDAIGAGSFAAVPPVGVFLGASIYSQSVFVDPATLSISGASPVSPTAIYF